MYFCSVGKGLRRAIRDFEIFPGFRQLDKLLLEGGHKKGAPPLRIDISAAYRNYEVMRRTVGGFSASFRRFFFVAEFTLVLCLIICTVAAVTTLQSFAGAAGGGTVALSRVLRLVCICCLWIGAVIIITALATVSSAITGEAQKVREKAHTVKVWVATHYPEDLLEAKHFYDHVESDYHTIGFRGFGITISPSLIAKTAYLCTSMAVTLASIMLRWQGGIF